MSIQHPYTKSHHFDALKALDAGAHNDWEHGPNETTPPPKDWAHTAARGVLAELERQDIVEVHAKVVDQDARVALIEQLSDVIRVAETRDHIVEELAEGESVADDLDEPSVVAVESDAP